MPTRTSPFPIGTSILTIVAFAYSGCGGQTDSSTGTTESALTASTDGGEAKVVACFGAYVDCRRADASEDVDCRRALHDCLRPPRPDGDGGPGGTGGGDCHGGPGGGPGGPGGDHPPPPPPDGDGGPPPPPDGAGDHPPPPPPPPDDDGPRPPRGEGDGDDQVPRPDGGPPPGEGPRACIEALDACADGDTAADQCVSDAVACFAKFPPPPPPPPRPRGDH